MRAATGSLRSPTIARMALDHVAAPQRPTALRAPVPAGPRAYRRSIRRSGALVALVPPAALGLLGIVLLRGSTSLARGVGGFLASCMAAPLLLVAGVPLADSSGRFTLGVVCSVALWMILGVWATVRATRSPVAAWGDYWREYAWLAAGMWLGVVGALVVANLLLGRALL